MSKASAISAINNMLMNLIPSINPKIIDRIPHEISSVDLNKLNIIDSKEWTQADADDAMRIIIKLDAIAETKDSAYKTVMDRHSRDRQETKDIISSVKHQVQKALISYTKDKLVGQHYDCPSGRMQLHGSYPIEIKIDNEELNSILEKLSTSSDPILKACVRIKYEPALDNIKLAIKSGHKIDWAEIIHKTNPTFYDKDNIPKQNKDLVNDESPVTPILVNDKPPLTPIVTSSPMNKLIEDVDTEKTKKTTNKTTNKPIIQKTQETSTHSPTGPSGGPSGTNIDLRPRFFSIPQAHHFVDSALKINATTFIESDIVRLLTNQDKVKPEHIETLPIEKIRSGFISTLSEIGIIEKPDVRIWTAYHLGKHPDQIIPATFDEATWRKLCAYAIHAKTIKNKYTNQDSIEPINNENPT